MPATSRPRRQPTENWDQLRLLVASPEQETNELLRPVVLFGQPATTQPGHGGGADRSGFPAPICLTPGCSRPWLR